MLVPWVVGGSKNDPFLTSMETGCFPLQIVQPVCNMLCPLHFDGRMKGRNRDVLTPREQMMRDEINLMRIASNKVTIVLQIIAVLAILAFTIYTGSTAGGIMDGSD